MTDNAGITQNKNDFDAGTNPSFTSAADEIAGVKYQRIKLVLGDDGVNDGDLSTNNPLPVSGDGEVLVAGTRHSGSLAAGSISGTYATLLTPGTAIRSLRIMNFTDGDIVISLDSGSTDHYALAPGKEFIENYGSNFLEITDDIEIKDGVKASTAGTVYALAYSD